MNNSTQPALGAGHMAYAGAHLDTKTANKIKRQMHHLSDGVEALAGLGLMMAYAIDEKVGITGDQVNSLLKCVEYRLLTSQKKIVKALKEDEKRQA